MPTAWQRTLSTIVATATSFPAGTETIACTLNVTDVAPDASIRFLAFLYASTGVGVTGWTPRIRRTGLTGTVVANPGTFPVTASQTQTIAITQEDAPGDVASLPYVLTLVSVAGTTTAITMHMFAIVG